MEKEQVEKKKPYNLRVVYGPKQIATYSITGLEWEDGYTRIKCFTEYDTVVFIDLTKVVSCEIPDKFMPGNEKEDLTPTLKKDLYSYSTLGEIARELGYRALELVDPHLEIRTIELDMLDKVAVPEHFKSSSLPIDFYKPGEYVSIGIFFENGHPQLAFKEEGWIMKRWVPLSDFERCVPGLENH